MMKGEKVDQGQDAGGNFVCIWTGFLFGSSYDSDRTLKAIFSSTIGGGGRKELFFGRDYCRIGWVDFAVAFRVKRTIGTFLGRTVTNASRMQMGSFM